MAPRDLALWLFLALAWGLSFLVLLKVVAAFGWPGAVSLRALVAGAALLALARLTRRPLDFSAGWRPFLVVGATTVAAQLIGLSLGTPMVGTAMAAILIATIPLFAMLIAAFWGLERITPTRAAGLALGLAGVALLVGFPAEPATPRFLLGCALTLLASLSAAFGSAYVSRRLARAGSWEVTTAAFLIGGLMTAPLLIVAPPPAAPGAVDLVWLLVLGIGMSALPYVVYFRLVAAIGATKTVSVEFAVTLVAVCVGALFLGEKLTAAQGIGAAVVVCGCMLILGLFQRPARG